MIFAEIGWNFLGDLSLAKKMILAAKDSKCKVVKFQLWDPKFLKPGPVSIINKFSTISGYLQ